jgi:hypothetical protein
MRRTATQKRSRTTPLAHRFSLIFAKVCRALLCAFWAFGLHAMGLFQQIAEGIMGHGWGLALILDPCRRCVMPDLRPQTDLA